MSNYKTTAKRPKGKEFEPVTMLDNHFGNHGYGVSFPDGKIYKEEKCEVMKSQTEKLYSGCKHICDSEEFNPRCFVCGELMRDDSINTKNLKEKYEIMKSKKEELNDETKSPLDEFIDETKKGVSSAITPDDSGMWDREVDFEKLEMFIESSIRLAVQKHAEAVIPEKVEMKNISDRDVALRNGVIDEVKSASDKWRGV